MTKNGGRQNKSQLAINVGIGYNLLLPRVLVLQKLLKVDFEKEQLFLYNIEPLLLYCQGSLLVMPFSGHMTSTTYVNDA